MVEKNERIWAILGYFRDRDSGVERGKVILLVHKNECLWPFSFVLVTQRMSCSTIQIFPFASIENALKKKGSAGGGHSI